MDARTKTALLGSIEKWEKIVDGTGVDGGSSNCPLCQLFNRLDTEDQCQGCPVFERTGETGCNYTPFDAWWDNWEGTTVWIDLPFNTVKSAKAIKLAQDELDFLRSLLPKEDVT